jgi:hypothetical protein
MTPISSDLFDRTWIHSHEEDTNNIKVYRPNTYKFPLARGREGFEIKKSGHFIHHGIGPTDRTTKVNGNWTNPEPNIIKVEFGEERPTSFKIKILSSDNDVLKVEKIDK